MFFRCTSHFFFTLIFYLKYNSIFDISACTIYKVFIITCNNELDDKCMTIITKKGNDIKLSQRLTD